MTVNYHTHTNYCDHAKGKPEEYIKSAMDAGITELGFSEHAPYIFLDGHESHYRIPKKRVGEYVEEIKALREKYADKIKIHIGLEIEYYPDYFEKTIEFLKPFDVEYLILGQHFLDNERGAHSIEPQPWQSHIRKYTEAVCEGMRTGRFTYLCHPDMINYIGSKKIYRKYAKIICQTAKECQVPLEFNLLGFSTNRCYPCKEFFSVAAEVGNEVILGVDAHSPERFCEGDVVISAKRFLGELGITPIEKLVLKHPFN